MAFSDKNVIFRPYFELEAIARQSVEASREVICAYFGNIGRNSGYFLHPIFLAVHPSAAQQQRMKQGQKPILQLRVPNQPEPPPRTRKRKKGGQRPASLPELSPLPQLTSSLASWGHELNSLNFDLNRLNNILVGRVLATHSRFLIRFE